MSGAVFLESDEVELRTIEEGDIEFLQQNINKEKVRKYLTARKPINMTQQQEFFQEVVSSDQDVHLAICSDGEIAGIISLEDEQDDIGAATIGLWIAPERQQNGVSNLNQENMLK